MNRDMQKVFNSRMSPRQRKAALRMAWKWACRKAVRIDKYHKIRYNNMLKRAATAAGWIDMSKPKEPTP